MIRRLAIVFGLVATVLLGLAATPANALPFPLPTVGDCKDAPAPAMPGNGVPGFFDGAPSGNNSTHIYDQHGYAGFKWSTYDLGCAGNVTDVAANVDAWVGNQLMGAATTITALAGALHNYASSSALTNALEPLVVQASAAVTKALYNPYLDITLLILGLWLILGARHGKMAESFAAFAWALLILGATAAIIDYPAQATKSAHDIITATVGSVNSSILGEKPSETVKNPAAQRTSLSVDRTLYPEWLRGEFGSPTSPAAIKYGRQLFEAQALTWTERAKITADPSASEGINKSHQEAWEKIAEQIKKDDPSAYDAITNHAHNKSGAGIIAFLATLATIAFPIVADFLVMIGLILISMIAIFWPALAIIGFHPRYAGVLKAVVNIGGAALINCVLFSIGAAVEYLAVGVILTSNSIPAWVGIIICFVISLVLWMLMSPLRRLLAMTGGQANRQRHRVTRTAKFVAAQYASYLGAEKGSEKGVKEGVAAESTVTPNFDPAARPEAQTRPAERYAYAYTGRGRHRPGVPLEVVGRPATDVTVYTPSEGDVGGSSIEVLRADQVPNVRRADQTIDPDGNTSYQIYNPTTKESETAE